MNTEIKKMSVNEETFPLLLGFMGDAEFATMESTLYELATNTDPTYENTLELLGDAEAATPASINFYAKDFESKEVIESFIEEYSEAQTDETKKIQYTDLIGTMMSSVSTIINVISYVLVAFVSVSLVVSSIMIGIITYISVLERTKEIGILRAIGASKRDISRVFNAETLIVGFAAGAIGVIFTVLLCLPINAIIHLLSGMTNINAVLPWVAAIVLVGISMFLTFIAGLIPAKVASKKDPVIALRTE
jgi:putative ABC transport system permease protein